MSTPQFIPPRAERTPPPSAPVKVILELPEEGTRFTATFELRDRAEPGFAYAQHIGHKVSETLAAHWNRFVEESL
ncbi:hypothetical protein [Agromyces larvae]|uniref:SRPBCC domain-containing protein n=1 Tax=Agromyces larvae TaxID=2929802 RepID=A0ABY4C6B5_9MICO|nr:hypothetical protein [Agromyces larvae]UOE45962.1 hypothetical protein MTO99_09535 [Agromyces larvae]